MEDYKEVSEGICVVHACMYIDLCSFVSIAVYRTLGYQYERVELVHGLPRNHVRCAW